MPDVVLPALNEAAAVAWVLGRMPTGYRAIVVDNGSTDDTARIAAEMGATVVAEPVRGFGSACWAIAGDAAAKAKALETVNKRIMMISCNCDLPRITAGKVMNKRTVKQSVESSCRRARYINGVLAGKLHLKIDQFIDWSDRSARLDVTRCIRHVKMTEMGRELLER